MLRVLQAGSRPALTAKEYQNLPDARCPAGRHDDGHPVAHCVVEPWVKRHHLAPLQQRILPLWKRYLAKKGQRNIRHLLYDAEQATTP